MKLAALITLLAICLAWPSAKSIAQGNINMPYSMYGVGELQFNQYFQNLGMGGISQGYRSNVSINDVNPASYSALDSTSFVFETTVFTHFYEQKTKDLKQQSDFFTLGNISVGFPVTRWWSFAAGLKPYSQLGYNIRDVQEHQQAGTVSLLYQGSGGLNQVFVGSAFEPVKGLSLGVNASYLFGNLDHEASLKSDSIGVFQTNLVNANQVSGWILGLGLQYRHDFTEYRHITIGASYGDKQDVNVNTTETLRRKLPGEMFYDTIVHVDLEDGRLSLPQYYGVGVYGRLNRQWAAGVDYQWQNWEAFEFLGKKENLSNSHQVSAGVKFNPTVETLPTIFHRLQYTAGVRYGQSYFQPEEKSLDEFGISFGTTIPIRGSLSALNLNFEYSRRGSVDNHFMKENFYRLNIGVNIYEHWFIRRRFY